MTHTVWRESSHSAPAENAATRVAVSMPTNEADYIPFFNIPIF